MTTAAPTRWYLNGIRNCIKAGLGLTTVTGTVKVMILNSSYAFDQDNHDFVDDVSAFQVTGTGVAAGGVALPTPVTTIDGPSNTSGFDGGDITGINVIGCYAVVYVSTATPATSPLISITDLSGGDGSNVIITSLIWNTLGIAGLSAAA